jgi:hypothetical protein
MRPVLNSVSGAIARIGSVVADLRRRFAGMVSGDGLDEVATAVEEALEDYRRREAAKIPDGRASLDAAALRLLTDITNGVTPADLRDWPAASLYRAYQALRALPSDDMRYIVGAQARRVSSAEECGQLGKELTSQCRKRSKASRSHEYLLIAIVSEYAIARARSTSAEAWGIVWRSSLFRRLASLPNQDGLEALAVSKGVDAIPARLIRRVVREWRRSRQREAHSSNVNLLRSALVQQAILRSGGSWGEETKRPLAGQRFYSPGTDAAQDLWLHLVTAILPAVDGYGDAKGEQRVVQDRAAIRSRLLAYFQLANKNVEAFCDLAEWFHVSAGIDDVCGAAMLWCYWHAFDPRQRVRQVFVEHASDRDKGQSDYAGAFATFSPLKRRAAVVARGSRLAVEWLSPCGSLTGRLRERVADGCWTAWDEAFVPHAEDEEKEMLYRKCAHLSLNTPGVWQNVVRALDDDC